MILSLLISLNYSLGKNCHAVSWHHCHMVIRHWLLSGTTKWFYANLPKPKKSWLGKTRERNRKWKKIDLIGKPKLYFIGAISEFIVMGVGVTIIFFKTFCVSAMGYVSPVSMGWISFIFWVDILLIWK